MARRIQAGAVTFRVRGKEPEFLLVTRRNNHRDWLFPKGNVKSDDTLEETALKELREEAGVEGVVVRELGRLRAGTAKDPVVVTYFLVHGGAVRPNGEGRKVRWFSLERAEEMLDERRARKLLHRAAAEVRQVALVSS